MISWFCNTNPHDSNPAKSGTIRRKSRWWGWYLKIVSWPSITDLVWSLQGLGWGVGVERLVGSQGRAPQKEEMGYLWKWKPKMNPDLWPALTAHPNHPHLPAYCPNHVLVIARRLKSNICNQPGLGDKRESVRISMFTKHCPREILVSADRIFRLEHVLNEVSIQTAQSWVLPLIEKLPNSPLIRFPRAWRWRTGNTRWETLMLRVLGNYGCL